MKRRDLIKKLEENGWYFLREGGNHDIYTILANKNIYHACAVFCALCCVSSF